MAENRIMCPLIDALIEDYECIENVDIVDGLIIETTMPEKFKAKEYWKEICKNCEYHNY